ncbi:hypothetical protein BgiMline_000882 [Biomphalaria glabrata]
MEVLANMERSAQGWSGHYSDWLPQASRIKVELMVDDISSSPRLVGDILSRGSYLPAVDCVDWILCFVWLLTGYYVLFGC